MPRDIEDMIMQRYYDEAIADERRFEGLVRDVNYLFVIEEDDEIAPDDQLVPYYIDATTIDQKRLSDINTINDGRPFNGIFRIPWKHPVLNTDKGETFKRFYNEAQNIKEQRSSQPWAVASGNSGGSGMKNQKVKKMRE